VLFGRQTALVAVALLCWVVRPPVTRPEIAFSILGLVGLVNLLSYALNRRGRYSSAVETLQIVLDAGAIAALAVLGGGLHSPLIVFFLAEILAAAVTLSLLGCWIATAAALAGLGAVALTGARPIPADLLLVHAVSIIGTGWLTMRLIDRLRGRLQFRAAAAAHEIKNAVHSANGLIHEALAALPAGGAGRIPLEAAVESLGGLSRLAQGLYRGSCVASRWLSLDGVVEDALLLAGPAFRQAGIRVEVAAGARSARLLADPEAIRHCVLNLLLNAAEHSEPASVVGIRIEQSLLCTRLVVTSRARAGGAPAAAGWGVGLSVVRSLLASQHGSLESRVGPGGEVRVTLVWRRWSFSPANLDFPDQPVEQRRVPDGSQVPAAVKT